MKLNRDTFGTRLRLERERRGISLQHIARTTKIKESLFAEIERGDDSKWPQGIFRRAHMCAYLSAVGLPVQPLLNEFLDLFPEDPAFVQPVQASAEPKADCPAVTQPAIAEDVEFRLEGRFWVALFDLSAIAVVTAIAGGLGIERLWMAAAITGLAYFTGGSVCFGSTPGSALRQMIQPRVLVPAVAGSTHAPLREIRMFVAARRDAMRTVRRETDQDSSSRADVQHQRASA